MILSELLAVLEPQKSSQVEAAPATEVLGLTDNTREVKPGWVFVAIRGTKADGHNYLQDAIKAGAIAVIVENNQKMPGVFSFSVENSRVALNKLAAQFYGNPSEKLFCLGVTGTNGKTSVTYLLEHIFNLMKVPMGVIGTINHHLHEKIWPTENTTPGPISLQKRLHEMQEAGAKAIAMEVTSHAIAQHRADSVHFNTVIFTNLTQDHLDYHKTMTNYFAVKQQFFTDFLWNSKKFPQVAVINIDDEWGRRLRVNASALIWTYGQSKLADFRFHILQSDFIRTDFELYTPFGKTIAHIPLCGLHNVANCVAAIAAAATAGIPIDKSIEALSSFPGVPGRLQKVPNEKYLNIFVDYAHTPDALENVLTTVNQVRKQMNSPNQIWTVFGCGGDRDQSKRPIMGRIASQLSDHVMITSDNPRTEDPDQIIEQILAGVATEKKSKVQTQVDRRKAFVEVFQKAKPHDVILIAGKGHEDYQIIGTEKLKFDDTIVIKELLL